jgi:hypothetical protein
MGTRESRPQTGPAPEPPPQTATATIQAGTVTTAEPNWTGCPMGCGQYGHGPPCTVGQPLRLVASCHHCLSLTWDQRQALADCASICPLRTVA